MDDSGDVANEVGSHCYGDGLGRFDVILQLPSAEERVSSSLLSDKKGKETK